MSEKKIFEARHLNVLERDGWEYVERKKAREAVAVVALTAEGKFILTEQFRRPVNARVIDWPAGLVGDEREGEQSQETARKELEEEAGYRADRFDLLASGPSSPGITSEIVSFYRAVEPKRVSEGGGVGDERITVHEVDRDAIEGWLRSRERDGVLIDLKVWGGLYFVSKST